MSINDANIADITGFFNSSIKYISDTVAISGEEILGIFTLCGGKYTMSEMRFDLVSVTKIM